MRMLNTCLLAGALALSLGTTPLHAQTPFKVPPSGVLGMDDAKLSPDFWVAQLTDADRVVMDARGINALNQKVLAQDPSMHDIRALPASIGAEQVKDWINKLAKRPEHTLYDVHGQPVSKAALDAVFDNRALDAVPASAPTRFGMAVRRTALRGVPTDMRVFSHADDTDIDRFQESALFPGDPVVIAHASADGHWLFVVSPRYAAWVAATDIAQGRREDILAHVDATPYRIITGAKPRTVFTPEAPAVSEAQLDMGTRVPLDTSLSADQPVNGEGPYTSWVLSLPVRKDDGTLAFQPALLQRNQESSADYLPLTRANIVRQAFKFLGERYGWGHAYNGRDCSGFVSDVYRSMGVQMPRNTRDQSISPGLQHTVFGPADKHEARVKAALAMDVGDMIYIPGHVMMVIGKVDGQPYVIHDVSGMSYVQADGSMRRVKLNAVSVTPLLPMMANAKESFVDHMTSIVRIRP
jgi:cell wall-associated NlpC family hydrolase